MATVKSSRALHVLAPRQVMNASDGDLSDGGGLTLRVREGVARWTFRYTSPAGKRRELGLGVDPRASLQQIGATLKTTRTLAHQAREQVRLGVDPVEARKDSRQAARQVEVTKKADKQRDYWTLCRCARDYHEREVERDTKISPRHAAQWISSLENHVPRELWHAPIHTIEPQPLLTGLSKIKPHARARRHGDLGETVRRILQRLSSVFDDAIFYKRCTLNPAAAITAKLSKAKPRAPSKPLRHLDYREAPALLARIRAVPGTAARALEFAVLCAARTGEVLGCEWSEINLDTAVWRVPGSRMKGGEDHDVFLSAAAVQVLKLQRGQHPRWVFPTPQSLDKPLSNEGMRAVLKRIGAHGDTTPHGLARGTFSTWANDTNAARPDVVEACLAHKEEDRVRRAYNHAAFTEERRALLAAWADHLARPAAQVVKLAA